MQTDLKHDDRKESRTANIGLPKAGLTCLIEQLCLYFTFVLADRLVLLMPRLRQASNVGSYAKTTAL